LRVATGQRCSRLCKVLRVTVEPWVLGYGKF
jgi:hypothetical protein